MGYLVPQPVGTAWPAELRFATVRVVGHVGSYLGPWHTGQVTISGDALRFHTLCYLILQEDTPDAISWLSGHSVSIRGKGRFISRVKGKILDRWAGLEEERMGHM